MRVALVHDNLVQFGGAERVLAALMEAFPNAPVYTLLYDRDRVAGQIDESRIRTSWLQRVPGAKRRHYYFPLMMPLAIEQFDFTDYDIVLSDTYSYAKGVITGPGTMHLSYCFTPIRYVWDDCHKYVRDFSRLALYLRAAPLGLSYIRRWDYLAAQRVDSYLTLSHFVARRIKKYYRHDAEVIYPPVDVDAFHSSSSDEGYYLVVARLVPYKRVDLAIKACRQLGVPLKVVGIGPEIQQLRQLADSSCEFLEFVSDAELPSLYAGARALLFPQEEDFGITPLEAAASGKPTIAYGVGGARETVIDGVTGVLFAEQTVGSLVEAMKRAENMPWDPQQIRRHAQKFSRQRFVAEMRDTVDRYWKEYKTCHSTRT